MDLPFHAPDALSTGAFVAIVLSVCVALVAGVEGTLRARVSVGIALWLGITAALPASGLMARVPPLMPAFFVGSLAAAVALALSPVGASLARRPLWALIGFQGFRLPLEGVLHHWAAIGTVPETMTWTGPNVDVITGIALPIAAAWLWRRPDRPVAWAATALGLGLLLNVMRVALLSAPLPLPGSYHADPPLVLALHAPYAWIVSICVAGALVGHLVAIRALLAR